MPLSYREIPLSGKAGRGKVAVVDAADFSHLSQFRWHWLPPIRGCVGSQGYAVRNLPRTKGAPNGTISMHREIMQPPPGYEVDHIRPGSGLDNRRCNLRVVDHATNTRNKARIRTNASGYRGVSWHKVTGKWQASINRDARQVYLGLFENAEAAHEAYERERAALGWDAGLVLPPEVSPSEDMLAYVQPARRNNRSGYRGVSWCEPRGKWLARIKAKGKLYTLGRYDTAQAASAAYEAARVRLGVPDD